MTTVYPYQYDLDRCLLRFSDQEGSIEWTARNAVEGVQVFGCIGSGKSSGSGRAIALKYLREGFGFLVLTVKKDEKQVWEDYCRQAGRLYDLMVIEPGSPYCFDFVSYEATQCAADGSLSQTLLQVLKTVIDAHEDKNGNSGEDSFWNEALYALMSNAIDLCFLAHGKVTIPLLYDIVISISKKRAEDSGNPAAEKREADKSLDDKRKALEKTESAYEKAMLLAEIHIGEKIAAWIAGQENREELLRLSNEALNLRLGEVFPDSRLLMIIRKFFLENYETLSPKTRSVIDFKFLGFLNQLLRDPAYSLFCSGKSNFSPEDSLNGKILLINLPLKVYHHSGQLCQTLFKYIWQRAMERRDTKHNNRVVVLWCDESQLLTHPYDAECQATARSSRIATVYLTQNIANYYTYYGGKKAEYRVKTFLGTLATHIYHSNIEVETNDYASRIIGDGMKLDFTRTDTMSEKPSAAMAMKLELKRRIRPDMFLPLKTGGPRHQFEVEAYIVMQGKQPHNPYHFKKIVFHQLQSY